MALNVNFNDQPKRLKVMPNTTMFQVLAEAHKQFGLSDTRQYQLLHRGKPIELSSPFQLTGISNNASVELVELKGEVRVEQVRVGIQLRDGKRVQAPFNSETTLDHILTFFKLLPASETFSLDFLRRKIDCGAFSTTTLKDLGILSGSAIFRVQKADVQQLSAALPVQKTSAPPQQSNVSLNSITSSPSVGTATSLDRVRTHSTEDVLMEDAGANVGFSTMSSIDALQILRGNNFDAVSRVAITTLMKIVTNILSDIENEKVRSIRLSNAMFHRSVGKLKGGIDFLASIGFDVIPETNTLVLRSSTDNRSMLEEGLRLLHAEADDLNIPLNTRPVVREVKASNFDVFKTNITRVQIQPRGPSATKVLLESLKSKEEQLIGHQKPPRNTIVSFGEKQSGNFNDSTLESSERSDAQLLISSLKARHEEMKKAQTFRTQAMRELDELKRKRVFQTALIRVQFPDRAVIQASFHPNEKVQDVMDHVTNCLDDQFKAIKFYLYVTPPTQKLVVSKTLIELNLVPAALLYLSWEVASPETEVPSVGFYFCRDLLTHRYAEANKSGCSLQQAKYPKPLRLENTPTIETSQAREEPAQQISSSTAKPANKPSWLKL